MSDSASEAIHSLLDMFIKATDLVAQGRMTELPCDPVTLYNAAAIGLEDGLRERFLLLTWNVPRWSDTPRLFGILRIEIRARVNVNGELFSSSTTFSPEHLWASSDVLKEVSYAVADSLAHAMLEWRPKE